MDEPTTDKPLTDEPTTDKSLTDEPATDKPTITDIRNREQDLDGPSPLYFSWGLIQHGGAGDCTMFEGAHFILYPWGEARFDGTVTSSDDNDTWKMWIHLKDYNNADLGWIDNKHGGPPERNLFAKFMPDSSQRYRWLAEGEFNKDLFSLIGGLTMDYRC